MKLKSKHLLLLGLLAPSLAFGQAQNNLNSNDTKAPSTQSNVFGVDLFTGTANASIPIYNYSLDGLNLGILLTHSMKGHKIDDIVPNTGLGWNLVAGGSIDRSVYDIEDEIIVPYNLDTPMGSMNRIGSWLATQQSLYVDDGPDLFYLNLCGKSYTFTLKIGTEATIPQDRQYRVFPKSELDIEFGAVLQAPTNMTGRFQQDDIRYYQPYRPPYTQQLTFKVTDEKGNRFFFEAADYEITRRSELNDTSQKYDFRPVNRWLLSKIITHTGQEVRYFYQSFDMDMPYYTNNTVTETFASDGSLSSISGKKEMIRWTGKVYQISRIEYPNGTIAYFDYDTADPTKTRCDNPGSFPLKSIRIAGQYEAAYKNEYSYRFNYAYFNSPFGANSNTEIPYPTPCADIAASYQNVLLGNAYLRVGLRLKLKGIDKVGMDGATVEPLYRFSYNETPLPPRFSPSKDYYGYYNGKAPANPSVPSGSCASQFQVDGLQNVAIPKHTLTPLAVCGIPSITYGVDKTPDINYLKACVLNRISNGSGGETEFTFKDHVLSNPTNQYNQNNHSPAQNMPSDLQGGDANDGLCIDQIIVRDGFSADNTVTHQYEFSDGQRFYRGGWFWLPLKVMSDGSIPEKQYKEHFAAPQEFPGGSNHGYSFVTEKTFGYNGELLSFKKHTYSNLIDYWNPSESNLQFERDWFEYPLYRHTFRQFYFRSYRIGLLVQTQEFDPNGNLLSTLKNDYGLSLANLNGKAQPVNQIFSFRNWSNSTISVSGVYVPFTADKMNLLKSTTTRHQGAAAYSTDMVYSYDSKDNLKYVEWKDSRNRLFRKHYNYFYNLHAAATPDQQQYVMNSSIWLVNSPTDSVLVNGTGAQMNISALGTPVRTQGVSDLNIESPVPAADAGGTSGVYYVALGNTSVAPALAPLVDQNRQFKKYDAAGNVTETYEAQVKTQVAKVWDSRTGENVAEIVNARYDDVAYTSFEGKFKTGSDDNKGHWEFDSSSCLYNPAPGAAMTGKYLYSLNGGAATVKSSITLQGGKKYLLTFWATGAPSVALNNNSQLLPVALNQARQVGQWKLYVAQVSPASGGYWIELSGAHISLDELRLHPVDAVMTSTTYEPLWGPNSHCDALNNITYTDYDAMGRAKMTRDINGNIRSFVQTGTRTTDN